MKNNTKTNLNRLMKIGGTCLGVIYLVAGALAQIPPTPQPVYEFNTGTGSDRISIGGSPADAGIAVSRTHIVLTARAAFACYTKGGSLVPPGPGFDARPYTAKEFFEQSGLGPIIAVNGGNNYAKDGRVVFSQVHRRFFLVFQSREAVARLLIAVSKSEDPRDGWWTYADVVGSAGEWAHDYQWLGVNGTHLLVSNGMVSQWSGGSQTRTLHLLYTVADLINGRPYTRGEWSHVDAKSAVPCVHDTFTTDAFWIHRDDNTHATVWAVRNGQVSRRQFTIQSSSSVVNGTQLGGTPVVFNNIGRAPQNCHYRDGKIVFVSNDGYTWSGRRSPNNAIRLVRVNVSQYFAATPSVQVEIDRIFGRSSVGDPAGNIYDYGWPAVAMNSQGDIVIGSIRTRSTIYPEQRASVWFAGQPDISSSVSVQTSSSPLSQFHMAGASSDPSTRAVYLAQQYGAGSPSWRMHVAKVLGSRHPDLLALNIQAPVSVLPGGAGTATLTIINQGDASMPASQGTLYLSDDNFITTSDTSLATFGVQSLAPSESTSVNVPFTLDPDQPPCRYFIGAALDSGLAAVEYSEVNNLTPFKIGDHGNAPVIVASRIVSIGTKDRAAGGIRITFHSCPKFYHTLYRQLDLRSADWTPVAMRLGDDGIVSLFDPDPPVYSQAFYRIGSTLQSRAGDIDGDSLDDVYELRAAGLDPLNPSDGNP